MTGIRNLSHVTQFKVLVPDISPEEAKRNVPWVMRLDIPDNAQFLGVVEIDYPFNPLTSFLGPSPKKTIGYAYQLFMGRGITQPTFITSVFTGTNVPWPRSEASGNLLMEGMMSGSLACRYLGITSHTGILLVHIATTILREPGDDPLELADALEEEMKDTYLIVRPKEYDLDKRLLMLMQANVPAGSPEEKIAEAAKPTGETESGKT